MRGYRIFFFRLGPTLTNFSVLVDEERGDANTLKAGNHGPASETPFKGRFASGPMMAQH